MKTGLVLSGGGARGIAHIGVIKALLQNGIRPDIISGTSSGAFVGAMLAYGHSPDDILEAVIRTSFYPYLRFGFGAKGLLRMSRMEAILCKYIPENSFESLKIPLIVTATDIVSGEEVHFRKGVLATPVLASCSIPGLFSPVLFQGHSLVDGGVLNNLPVEPVLNEAEFIIGMHCNPFALDKPLKTTSEIVYRSMILAMHSKTKERFKKCNLLIEPPELSRYSIFDFRKARQLFDVGYRYTMALLQEGAAEKMYSDGLSK
ncbi:patatin-like phospholipase family protein [Dyadobacter flavalbus]|uniref:Patatin-like phospholipase family protein n=1 Tax=Dyadobacter flavalbus TaxID=2579942 RepID=A0A5M8Q352_9BACT|nr:patatin-like phospholipase family protein [Dyadobacter flavalbus]KAA6430325.1 patatin-like phospholipase family protein [Dyadobacter flavalbus]